MPSSCGQTGGVRGTFTRQTTHVYVSTTPLAAYHGMRKNSEGAFNSIERPEIGNALG